MGLEVMTWNSKMSQPQIDEYFFRNTLAVISPHGGAMYNFFACPPGTVVLEVCVGLVWFGLFGSSLLISIFQLSLPSFSGGSLPS